MARKLKVLMAPLDAIGCFNPCIGIGQELLRRGHTVVFSVPNSWKNKLVPYGFVEEWLEPNDDSNPAPVVDAVQVWGEIINKIAPLFVLSQEEQVKVLLMFYEEIVHQIKGMQSRLTEIINKLKPDVIIVDTVIYNPAIMNSGIPWILSVSLNPIGISAQNVPPAYTGFPTGLEHKITWDNYMIEYDRLMKGIFEDVKDWVFKCNGPNLEYTPPYFMPFSPYGNIYMFPEELDYTEFRPNPPNFHRFDTFIRKSDVVFDIPDILKNKPGKLIYFSMGTIGCAEVTLIKRIIGILAKSPNRFIVSKGPLAHTYELADNMWGAPSVPQTNVIPLVDLVISHGGNNTVTESFYFGKPLIILPLFADQLDNAQRISETGLGIRFHAYKVSEEELLGGIEKLLGDRVLGEKMKNISKRIQGADNLVRVSVLIENIAAGK